MESPSRLTGHCGETLAIASAPLPSRNGMATGADSANCPTRAVRRARQRRGFYISVFRVAFSDACLTSAQ